MFQVVVQAAMRQVELKLTLPAPSSNRAGKKHRKKKNKDRAGFILAVTVGGGILPMVMFANFPKSGGCGHLKMRDRRPINKKTPTISRKRF